MIDEPAARDIARGELTPDEAVLGAAHELDQGWFFPCVMRTIDAFAGVIVNKQDGRPLTLMVDWPMAQDLTLYDRGYQFNLYDLVILTTDDIEQTVSVLHDIRPFVLDVCYKFDRVYRVGRGMTEDEIRENLPKQ